MVLFCSEILGFADSDNLAFEVSVVCSSSSKMYKTKCVHGIAVVFVGGSYLVINLLEIRSMTLQTFVSGLARLFMVPSYKSLPVYLDSYNGTREPTR